MARRFAAMAAALLFTSAILARAQDAPAPITAPAPLPVAPYHAQDNWIHLPPGRAWGASSVDMDRDGKSVWVLERCGNTDDGCKLHPDVNPIMKFDAQGNLVKAFGAGLFAYPHGLFIDRQDHVWAVDGVSKSHMVGNTIRIFDQDGKLLRTIGQDGVRGKDALTFNGASDVLQAPNGDIFVADGHDADSNARIVKYDRNGKFLMEWGQRGDGPADFNPPHGLAMDKEGRLYVADRGNRAVKRFSQDGKLLDVWTQFGAPSGVFVDKNDVLYVSDATSRAASGFTPGIRMAKVSDGKIFGNIPWPEQSTIEGVAVADDGTVYGGFTNVPGTHRFLKN